MVFFLALYARRAKLVLTWKDVTVMTAQELSIVQVNADIVETAKALLNGIALGEGIIHAKAHPDLLEHTGWVC